MREAIIRALRFALGTALAALTLGLAAPALATDYYLKMEGVEGEAQSHERADTIEVLSWSWGEEPQTWSVEREMKESGVKGGNAETTWKIEKGEKAAGPAEARRGKKGYIAPKYNPGEATSASQADPDRPLITGRIYNAGAAQELRSRPDSDGAGMIRLLVRAGSCHRGARYRTATIGTHDGVRTLHDVTVTSCIAQEDVADRPTEEIALIYERIE
ncbi:type VI secretion system tube protein Hcp [Qipengyuania sp. CAU 1752]